MSETEKQTTRIEAFSDGVFAIAITLLILELRIPMFGDGDPPSDAKLLSKLAHDWHHYLAFFLSFTSILVMWVNHHRIFSVVRKADDAFIYWNGLLLMFITIVPFPTGLIAEYMDKDGARTAAAVYSGMGFLIALAYNGLWQHATRGGRLLAPGHEREVNELTEQYRWGPLSYLVAFVLAFFSARLSIGICLGLVVFFAFRSWTKRT
jgi:uncharacterized membrane protein